MHTTLKQLITMTITGTVLSLAIFTATATASTAAHTRAYGSSPSRPVSLAHAPRMSPQVGTGSTGACTDTSSQACLSPFITVLENNTSACPGNQQYFTATDLAGNPIYWTYSNGSHACVSVDYYPVSTATCRYWFYVPEGHATANVIFGYWTTDGVKHYAPTLNENPVFGWQPIFTSANVTRINFQDNNGQTPGSTEIGWGAEAADGLAQTC